MYTQSDWYISALAYINQPDSPISPQLFKSFRRVLCFATRCGGVRMYIIPWDTV